MEISFAFFNRFHLPIENNILYELRREVARTFQNYGFGEIIEIENDKFANTFAIPVTDRYYEVEQDLFISFRIENPREINHGDLAGLLLHGIPDLQFWTRTRYLNMLLIPRINYN